MNNYFTYKGNELKEISFPLGGIGMGCIGLAGNGSLIDWEIYNRPNKGSINGFTNFAVKAEEDGKIVDARILNGDFLPPYTGMNTNNGGFGPSRSTLAGVPHFKEVEFTGEFPIATLSFRDEKFPGAVKMTAFNPFIPLDDKNSTIPGAFFEIEITNELDREITYTVCASLSNPLHKGSTYSKYKKEENISLIKLGSDKYKSDDVEFGDLSIATDHEDISYQEYWYRGAWFDNLSTFWSDFTGSERLNNRTYNRIKHFTNTLPEHQKTEDVCSLAAHIKIGAGEKKSVRFIIAWNFPNCYNYWNPDKCDCGTGCCTSTKPETWKNYYAVLFKDSTKSAFYSLKNWDRLYGETLDFKNTLFSSTLPPEVLEAVSANISILKTPTSLRLEDGSFYGWEGCSCNSGCCEGSCTHVWNYAYALPFLFPSLERSMRDLDFRYNQREDGSMSFRLMLPLGRERMEFRACADGQFGGVIKAYREWKICGDTEWLKSIWDKVKKSIDFAWSASNEDKWDEDMDGVLEGRQHHTLDMELFGANSWLNGFYLAALKAGAEMAEHLGDKESAEVYSKLFQKGKAWTDEHLFNGEYYFQLIDLKDKAIIDKFSEGGSLIGLSTEQAYWNEEKKEIKYQIGEGCAVDQVLAQWHANLCGLGEIFDREKTRKALQSIYKYNFINSFRDFFNPCRLYSLNDESGVIICSYPEGKHKPHISAPYAEETMNGFEYQAASHMLQEGFIDEGLEIVRAIRDRYDGKRRNPWNEFECGSNYARSMASYSLLLSLSGFEYDAVEGNIGFNPRINKDNFKCFWSLDSSWGEFIQEETCISIAVKKGCLSIISFSSDLVKNRRIDRVTLGDKNISFEIKNDKIIFEPRINIQAGALAEIKFHRGENI